MNERVVVEWLRLYFERFGNSVPSKDEFRAFLELSVGLAEDVLKFWDEGQNIMFPYAPKRCLDREMLGDDIVNLWYIKGHQLDFFVHNLESPHQALEYRDRVVVTVPKIGAPTLLKNILWRDIIDALNGADKVRALKRFKALYDVSLVQAKNAIDSIILAVWGEGGWEKLRNKKAASFSLYYTVAGDDVVSLNTGMPLVKNIRAASDGAFREATSFTVTVEL